MQIGNEKIISISWHEFERNRETGAVETVTYRYNIGTTINRGKMEIYEIKEEYDDVRRILIYACNRGKGAKEYKLYRKLENPTGVNKTYDCNIIIE